MRVLHYLPSLDLARGGPVRAVLDLANGLCGRGHSVTIATTFLGEHSTEGASHQRLVLTLLDGKPVVAGPLSSQQRAQVRELTASHDLVHVHGVWNYSNAQICADARAVGKPYVVSVRGMLDDWCMDQKRLKKRVYHALILKSQLERAAAVHCTAEAELQQARKWFPRGHGVVIPNLLNLTPYRTLPGPGLARGTFPVLNEGRPNILFLSRVHYKKRPEVLLRAAALLRDRGTPVTCVIAGAGGASYVRQLNELAEKLSLSQTVLFTGHIGGELKTSLYEACDLFALPTSQENFGFVFPEAMACGLPVLTTRGVDIWPELEASGGACIIEPTPEAFAAQIAALIEDPARRRAMAEKARPFVFSAFDEQALITRFEHLYRGAAPRTAG